ncbi:MAG: hypothetical protein CBE47_03820 [Pelagibacteraceae bacterium TMED287]|nr:MAG: hypothetical protein CBE47_03820 [Pelagibacteraceae bacterium TMED287]
MKKFFLIFLSLVIIILTTAVIFLSTKGYETERFNKLIINKINNIEPNIDLSLGKVKIKLDVQKLNLFLSTNSIKAKYNNINLPIYEVKVYFDLSKAIRSELNVNKIIVKYNEIDIGDIQKILVRIKPSNFKSFVLNNISGGKIKSNLDFDFDERFKLVNYKINGYIKDTKINLNDKINIKNINLNFISDNKTTFVNSIKANFQGIPISDGDIKIDRTEGIIIKSSLNTELKTNNEQIENLIFKYLKNDTLLKKVKISGNFLSKIDLKLDDDLKVLDYDYILSGNINNLEFLPIKKFESQLFNTKISKINLRKTKLNFNYKKDKKNLLLIEGEYNFNDKRNNNFKFENNFKKSIQKIKVNLDFSEKVFINLINYESNPENIANISTEIEIKGKEKLFKNITYKRKDNLISINQLKIDKKNNIKNFENIKVKTFRGIKENNNFELSFGKKIVISGKTYDSTNLIKSLNEDSKTNFLSNISKEVKISFDEILTKLSIPLNNFNLIGKIEKGKFVKILSKSEFENDQFLDITLKKNSDNKKILEIYSDLAKPMLADYSFFKGIESGQLLFISTFDDNGGDSNLQIKNFKVLNAPAFAKLLALADLGGLAVLLSGEGLKFESLEIKIKDNKKVRTIEEIYAVGPSLTILMDGYIENKSGLASLRGTMVPAKEINKLISKIPVLGNILIGKEVGEGVFGISFKMKGPPGKIKTTVNPIKTLTPRFITRALEKRKKENIK